MTSLFKPITSIAWALLFFFLPVTSFPFFPGDIGGKTLVRPLSVIPLTLLVFLVLIPRLISKPLPKTFLPLLAFIIAAAISSIAAFTFEIEALRGISLPYRFIRNILTLGIGCAFFFTISLLHDNWDDLDFSLRWLYLGFGVALLWGSIQSFYIINYSETYFDLISKIQSYVSTRKLFETRISGLTYEPKWFAEQIGFLLLPFLFGSIVSQKSVFKWRYRWFTVEWLLLIWSAVIMLFTFSRTGLFIFVALVIISLLIYRISRVRERDAGQSITAINMNRRRVIEIALITIGILGLAVVFGAQNRYISRFWRYWTDDQPGKKTYLEYIAFQQRFVYLQTALNMFEEYPVIGVGLGNYAYFFDKMIPDQPYNRQPEIIRQITPVEGRNRLITPKNLYGRLLAETGLFGTVTFTTFILGVFGCMLYMIISGLTEQKFWGLCGLMGFLVFFFVIFSYDSFALPNMWVFFGVLTSAAHISEKGKGLEAG